MVPFEFALWTTSDVAAYLRVTPKNVSARYTSRPDFPKPIVLPRADGVNSHPRWRAKDVVQWVFSFSGSTGFVPTTQSGQEE